MNKLGPVLEGPAGAKAGLARKDPSRQVGRPSTTSYLKCVQQDLQPAAFLFCHPLLASWGTGCLRPGRGGEAAAAKLTSLPALWDTAAPRPQPHMLLSVKSPQCNPRPQHRRRCPPTPTVGIR